MSPIATHIPQPSSSLQNIILDENSVFNPLHPAKVPVCEFCQTPKHTEQQCWKYKHYKSIALPLVQSNSPSLLQHLSNSSISHLVPPLPALPSQDCPSELQFAGNATLTLSPSHPLHSKASLLCNNRAAQIKGAIALKFSLQ